MEVVGWASVVPTLEGNPASEDVQNGVSSPPVKHATFLIGRYAHISETACGINVSLSSLDMIP